MTRVERKEYNRQWRLAHKAEIKAYNKEYKKKNSIQLEINRKQWLKENPEKAKKYRQRDNKRIAEYFKKRRKLDPIFRMKTNLRSRIVSAIKHDSKSFATIEYLGATSEVIKQHLESKFTEGMSWDNYGKWQIDHIIPCAFFDLSDKVEQKKCFHYTNLQPLWKIDNLKKGNKILC
jgi:hypothetical protein